MPTILAEVYYTARIGLSIGVAASALTAFAAERGVAAPFPFTAFWNTPMPTSRASTAPSDFDFIIGHWRVRHRRLNARLCGCTEWCEFEGRTTTQNILEGFGNVEDNVEDNVLSFPDGDVRAAAFRSFNPHTQSWAIWWLDGRTPHTLDANSAAFRNAMLRA